MRKRCDWHVDDIQRAVERLVSAGALVHQAIRDVGGGRRIVLLKADVNIIGLVQFA